MSAFLQSLESRRLFAAGDPVDNFGSHGEAPLVVSGGEFSDIERTPDGKLIVAAAQYYGNSGDFVRFNADGSPDTSFGDNGVVDSPLGSTRKLAVRSDGRFYAIGNDYLSAVHAGNLGVTGTDNWFVSRFLPSGRPDKSFGRHGRVALQLDRTLREKNVDSGSVPVDNISLDLDTDGHVTLLAYYQPNLRTRKTELAVFRYDATGRFDPTFNGGQPVALQSDADQLIDPAMTVGADGGILIAANRAYRHRTTTVALRITPSGVVDRGHTADGYYTVSSAALDRPRAVVSPDGHVFVSGTLVRRHTFTHYIYKLTAKGHADSTFAGGTVTYAALHFKGEMPLLPLADGSVVVGQSNEAGQLFQQHLRADGSTDTAFGLVATDGKQPTILNNVIYSLRTNSVLAQSIDGSGPSPFAIANHQLTLEGTGRNDDLKLLADPSYPLPFDTDDFIVQRGLWTRVVPHGDVTSAVINAAAGSDTVEIHVRAGLNLSVVINGGVGDDFITVTGQHITVHGGLGIDTVVGDANDSDLNA